MLCIGLIMTVCIQSSQLRMYDLNRQPGHSSLGCNNGRIRNEIRASGCIAKKKDGCHRHKSVIAIVTFLMPRVCYTPRPRLLPRKVPGTLHPGSDYGCLRPQKVTTMIHVDAQCEPTAHIMICIARRDVQQGAPDPQRFRNRMLYVRTNIMMQGNLTGPWHAIQGRQQCVYCHDDRSAKDGKERCEDCTVSVHIFPHSAFRYEI